jgi:hypothetical protein
VAVEIWSCSGSRCAEESEARGEGSEHEKQLSLGSQGHGERTAQRCERGRRL